MPSDELVRSTLISPATLGLYEGVEASLPDDKMPPLAAAELLNMRVYRGLWETRFGSTLYKVLPGFGATRWLFVHYQSGGARFRLAARGDGAAAALYDLEEGVDSAFQPTSGGTGLGGTSQPYFQGVTQNNRVYFTDRAGALRRYEPNPSSGNQVRAVVGPVKPAVAPTAKATWFDILEDWTNISGYVQSDTSKFELITQPTLATPDDSIRARLDVKNTSADKATITENVTSEVIQSDTIALWLNTNDAKGVITLELGIDNAGEFVFPLRPSVKRTWLPIYLKTSSIPKVNFKRFRVYNSETAPDGYVMSALYLPGRLDGEYRWIYTHYDSVTGRESAPSPISNEGNPLDLSAIGITNDLNSQRAFQKSARLTFTSDAGSDASTDKVRFYRNGGVPDLTKDGRGQDVWFLVGTVNDVSTTLNGGISAGATSLVVASATGLTIGDTLVLEKGTVGKEEFVKIANLVGTTVTLKLPAIYAHSNGVSIQMAFHDNVPNAVVDVLHPVDLARDDPPTGARWVSRSPDGRLWLFNLSGKPTGVAVSNRATPERPEDYEIFPQGVDPIVRRNLLQGWTFELGGDATDEEIVWGGLFQGFMHVLTRRNLYRIAAYSQLDFSPTAIVKVADVGCIAGDTVVGVNGVLTWVAEGPRVMMWDGQGAPRDVSTLRANTRLYNASNNTWINWFAIYHAKRDGHYYCLFFTPSGVVGNTQRLDYNADADLWEPVSYNLTGGPAGSLRQWQAAVVFDSYADPHVLYQADHTGTIYQVETGMTDNGQPISVLFRTKRFAMGDYASMAQELFSRLDGVSDTVSAKVTTGGSGDYDQVSHTYSESLAGTGDLYVRTKVERDLQGRWFEVEVSGDVSNRPAFKELQMYWVPIRPRRATDG